MANPHILDLTLPTPAENLACDEALLDACEANSFPGVLRFWESPLPFVVLGYANRAAQEANLDACRDAGVPVLRRCSGGGTVLQGPGCLNYSLALRIGSQPALASVAATNRFVMEQNRRALSALLNGDVRIEGFTDLTWKGRKFSGNAQRRRRDSVLFHGTFLVDFDLNQVARFLRLPAVQPDYRNNRSHIDFLTCLPLSRETIKATLQRAWQAETRLETLPTEAITRLVHEHYGREDWNLKWE